MIEILITLNLAVLLVWQVYMIYAKVKEYQEIQRVGKELREKLLNLEETAHKFFEENNKPEEPTNEQVIEENIEVAKKKLGRPKKDDTK